MNRKLVFVLLLSAAAVMVGLPQALAAQSVNVSIAGFAYNPAEITISKGTTVIWTQNDAANHTVTSDTGLFDSGNLTTGQTFSLTFNEIGTFKYHCTIHPFMKGTVNVIEMQQRFNISGYKINSTDNNGSGIPDWKIMLQNTTTGMEIMNTTTNATGFYRFMGLANGTYNVTEEMKTGWMNTSPMVQMVTINGIDKSNVNFTNALIPPTGGSISGMKFNDLNNNSAKDTNEPGLGNWTINLKDHNGSTVTATTDNNGNYTFSNLTPGNYTVAEVLKTGWIQTFPTNGTYNVTITGNESITGRDFGNNLSVPLPLGVTAVRTIEKESLRSGESTNVTVNISSTSSQALSLQEIIPAGWNLTRISDDADAFKSSTNEWVWFSVTPGINKTVVYRLTAPGNATIGTYHINGTVTNSSGVIAVVQGDSTITFDILAYYRRLGSDPNRVETTDVLRAIDDWKNSRAPAGFERPITTQELLALIEEWLMS